MKNLLNVKHREYCIDGQLGVQQHHGRKERQGKRPGYSDRGKGQDIARNNSVWANVKSLSAASISFAHVANVLRSDLTASVS